MLNILKNLNEKDFSKFGGIARDIRAMQEAIYKNKIVPIQQLFQMINLEHLME